jgi:hypothetical protein
MLWIQAFLNITWLINFKLYYENCQQLYVLFPKETKTAVLNSEKLSQFYSGLSDKGVFNVLQLELCA